MKENRVNSKQPLGLRTRLACRSRYGLWLCLVLPLLAWAVLFAPIAMAQAAGILYAKPVASGNEDCSSWADACTLLTALASAASGDEIWVAEGLYKPAIGANRTATFQLVSGVGVYGGFAGTEIARVERDPDLHLTVLSGDIDYNDITDPHGVITDAAHIMGANSYHVVTGSGADASALLDGVTVSGGQADGSSTDHRGGGMINEAGSPTLIDVAFRGNAADEGGGMANEGSNPTLASVTLSGNSADVGGGIYNSGSSSPTLANAILSGNSADDGGGIYNTAGSSPMVVGVTFYGNTATSNGGGVYSTLGSSPAVTNCILWDNTAASGGDQIYDDGSTTVAYSDVQGSWTGTGNIDANPLFVDADGPDGIAGTADDDLRLQLTSPAVDAGNNAAVPADTPDLDGDGDTTEPIPFDLDGLPRFVDVPLVADTGMGTPPIVEMGAYEVQPPPLIYVDVDATGNADGSSWADAFTDLQDALAWAVGGVEIWVAEGIYKPAPGVDRDLTFPLKSGVGTYGGFAGSETAREQRDWTAHVTVLSGDIDDNDLTDPDGVVTDTADIHGANSYHVVTGSDTDASAVLDGFTITGGQASSVSEGSGGGMYVWAGSPTLANVGFSGNTARSAGGGLYSEYSSMVLTHVAFRGNKAAMGGAMFHHGFDSPTLAHVTFSGNASEAGGGMYNSDARPALVHVTFSGNTGQRWGGGMYNERSSPVLTDVTFSGNTAGKGGGMYNDESDPILTDVTFSGNSATDGGGMFNDWYSNPALTHVTFSGNVADNRGGGMHNHHGSHLTLTGVTFVSNTATDGGGIYSYACGPILVDVAFRDNSATNGGGMANRSSSPDLTNVTFSGNSANGGGGMHNDSSSPTLANVTISGNTAAYGGGMHNYDGSGPALVGVTFSGNTVTTVGGGIYNYLHSTPTLTNCILWGNVAPLGGDQIYDEDNSSAHVGYSDVEGGWTGAGNVDADPLFVDADGPDDIAGTADDDLRLQLTSPAIDAGRNDGVPADAQDLDRDGNTGEPVPFDLGEHPRFADVSAVADSGVGPPPVVDMGAYEAPPNPLFVDAGAVGKAHGSSWADALTDLQTALAWAQDGVEVWVAEGVYRPAIGADREATFQLVSGVGVYGGFVGTETARDQRDPAVHLTVLSGDIDDNDTSDASGVVTDTTLISGTNSYHVVSGSGTDPSALLDGVTITGGRANGSSPGDCGGGLYNLGGSPTLQNLTFAGNQAEYGGGICNYEGDPWLANVVFVGNTAQKYGGGAINALSSPTLVNVAFSGNTASFGGGMGTSLGSRPTLVGVTLSGNSADRGGGLYNYFTGSPTLTNCILWGNTASACGDQICNEYNGNATVTYSTVQGGWTGAGNIDAEPLFADADGPDGVSGTPDDDLRLQLASPAIDAGNNDAVPPDWFDLDGDGDTAEPLPFDLDWRSRFVDVADVADTGIGTPPIVDMGAYEAYVVEARWTIYLPLVMREYP